MNIEIVGKGSFQNKPIAAPIDAPAVAPVAVPVAAASSMLVKSNLLVILNGYYHDEELDNLYINSIYKQNNKNFSLLFIDPYTDKIREEKINKLETDTGIQSLYLPYQRDPNPRKFDWCVRNIGCLLMENGRFFNWLQHRMINENFINIVHENPEKNIGCIRSWLMDNTVFDNGPIDYLMGDSKTHTANLIPGTALFQSSDVVRNDDHNSLKYCFYDCVLRVDDFIELNGTDEALTSYIYEEDWDIEERWDIARSLGKVHPVIAYPNLMLYFGHSRSLPYDFEAIINSKCNSCSKDNLQRIKLINDDQVNDVDGMQYLGIIDNYIEWFKCIECGVLYVRTGLSGFESFTARQHQYNKYKASIGIDGRYGRNLKVLREDVLNSKDWHEACEVINNSWYNKKYYQ